MLTKKKTYSLPKIGDMMAKGRLDAKPVSNSLDVLFLIVFVPRERLLFVCSNLACLIFHVRI